jgi:hypothetical protein
MTARGGIYGDNYGDGQEVDADSGTAREVSTIFEHAKALSDALYTKRPISAKEAEAAARRLIAGSFRRDGERLDDHPRFTIPADPDRDDDLIIMGFIRQHSSDSA